jgi:DNA-binding NarL/FixJ family response regulator
VRVGDVEQLVRAIREVAAGGSVLDPRIVERLLAHRSPKPGSPLAELTPAELDVLRLMAEGLGNKPVADALFLSVHEDRSSRRATTLLRKRVAR